LDPALAKAIASHQAQLVWHAGSNAGDAVSFQRSKTKEIFEKNLS